MQAPNRLATFNSLQFPELPFYEARWSPIYWEPILLSGERLAALIAALGHDGKVLVQVIIRKDVLKVLFPEKSEFVYELLTWAAEDLEAYISKSGQLEGWAPPITGLYLGNIYQALSTDLQGVILQAISMCASLSSTTLPEIKQERRTEFLSQDRWSSDIRKAVVQSLPRLEQCFNRPFIVLNGARATQIDFIGQNLAANFGRIIPGQLSRSLKDSKAKLLDLAVLRDEHSLIPSNEEFKLMIWRPDISQDYAMSEAQIKSVQEALLELEGEGRSLALAVSNYSNVQTAASEICKIEIAA